MTATFFQQAVGIFQRTLRALSKEPYQLCGWYEKPVRDDVVFRRASSSLLEIRDERVNSLSTLRDAPPRCMSKCSQKP
jgi:hypothetical protein